jgi:hypothetical protein
MFPAETDYLFFMLHKDGGHVFSTTYREHLAHLKAFRAYQKQKQEHNTTKIQKKTVKKKSLKKVAEES